ncbi:MAG: hypothetical protein GF353_12845 [Candidatus Lokiarchaeota archaeon]|nr:hypothetical protein [Candidatus Lokiarchaeota archaeon]
MSFSEHIKKKESLYKRKKEVLIILLLGLICISTVFVYTYIVYSPIRPENFPVVNISTEEEINKDEYVECTLELKTKKESDNVAPLKGEIKIRGKFNAELPKKGYRIQLNDDVSFLGMREDDDWMLFAMYSDLTSMQIKLSMDLYRQLRSTNPTAIMPECEYVCLYINREFQGLYLLVEKNDRRLFGLDEAQNSVDSSLIFQSSYAHKNFEYYLAEEWEQDWPNEYEDIYIMEFIMNELVSFIRDCSNETFFSTEEGIYTKFDKTNLIDFYVFNFFILHDDFWDHNYFIVRNTYPSKFFLVPWDFDRCFGQWLRRTSEPETSHEEFVLENNLLFSRLLQNQTYRKECSIRWFELREDLWTEDKIINLLTDYYDEIKKVLDIDTNMWYHNLWSENWEEEIDKAIRNLFNWIPERLEYCDLYFRDF